MCMEYTPRSVYTTDVFNVLDFACFAIVAHKAFFFICLARGLQFDYIILPMQRHDHVES